MSEDFDADYWEDNFRELYGDRRPQSEIDLERAEETKEKGNG